MTRRAATRRTAGAGTAARAGGTETAVDVQPGSSGDPVLRERAATALDGEVLGHERAKAALAAAGAGGTMHHAWLLHGPSGIGKCTLAVRLAALLANPETTEEEWRSFTPSAQGECARFLRLGTHPDIRLIRKELASTSVDAALRDRKQLNIPVGLLREHIIGGHTSEGKQLEAPAWRTSWLGGGKVFIIDEAELLDAEGQNALLKTLEEPPPKTWFVLVASHAERLLPTIRSRCQIVPMSPLSSEQMDVWAAGASVLCGVDATERAWALHFAEGSPGAASLAVSERLHQWWLQLEPHVRALAAGRFPGGAAEAMAQLVSEYAEAAVKRDPWASKDAANRRAVSIILHMLGESVRATLRRSDLPRESLERWSRVPGVIAEVESSIDANVNLKIALAYLISACREVLDTRGCAA